MASMGYRIPIRVDARHVASTVAGLGLLAGIDVLASRIGEAARLPIPGSVLGMLFVATLLALRPRLAEALTVAPLLLQALPLLFVPLVVGAIAPAARLGPRLPATLVVVVIATAAAAAAGAGAARIAGWTPHRSR